MPNSLNDRHQRIIQKLNTNLLDENLLEAKSKLISSINTLNNQLQYEYNQDPEYALSTVVALEEAVNRMVNGKADAEDVIGSIEYFRNTARNSRYNLETKKSIYMTAIALTCVAILTGLLVASLVTNPIGGMLGFALFVVAAIGIYYRESLVRNVGWEPKKGTFFSFSNPHELSGEDVYENMIAMLSLVVPVQCTENSTSCEDAFVSQN